GAHELRDGRVVIQRGGAADGRGVRGDPDGSDRAGGRRRGERSGVSRPIWSHNRAAYAAPLAQTVATHANNFFTPSRCTSVKRKSRPWKRKVSLVCSSPSRCRIVACRSWTCTRSAVGAKPNSSVSPRVTPAFTPPPASHIVYASM